MTSSPSLCAGIYLTSVPISNTGGETFLLLPKVIHLVNDSRIGYGSWCHSITPQSVTIEICPNKKRNVWARGRNEKAAFKEKAVLSVSHVAFQNQLFKYTNTAVQISSLYKAQGSKAGQIWITGPYVLSDPCITGCWKLSSVGFFLCFLSHAISSPSVS